MRNLFATAKGIANFDKIAEHITPEQLAEAIGAKRRYGGWRCPLSEDHRNSDRKPSLSFYYRGARLLVKCHGSDCELQGSPVQVYSLVWECSLREAGLALSSLIGVEVASYERPAVDHTRRQAIASRRERKKQRTRGTVVERYDYVDENGELLYQVTRLEPKNFPQRRPDGRGGWIYNLNGTRRVPYRLPQLIQAVLDGKTIYIVEGEKDVEVVERAGGIATTNSEGAGKWREDFSEFFRGADVVIVADRDDDGLRHALSICEALTGIASSVVIVEPAIGKDAFDHLSAPAGLGLKDFLPIVGKLHSDPVGPGSEGNAAS